MNLENWKHEEYQKVKSKDIQKETSKINVGLTASMKAWKTKDIYGILGVAHDFSPNELRRAYRKESLANHPDKGGSDLAFQRVAEAHGILQEPKKLEQYNKGSDLDDPNTGKLCEDVTGV